MPSDKKKSNSGGKGSADQKIDPKLHATAKAFVPSATTLQATASSWKPTSGAKPAKNGAKDNGKASAGAAAANAKPSAAEAVKQAPPKAPAASAWGSKKSDAIKTAAPSRPQQNRQSGQRQNQQQGERGGQGNRGDNRGGNRRDPQGGGGNQGGGSWSRAAKPSGGDPRDQRDGGQNNRRGSSHRDNNRGNNERDSRDRDDNSNSNWTRGKVLPVELMEPGEGKTDAETAVKRINHTDLLAMRMTFLNAPASWEDESKGAPAACLWDTPTRVSEIEEAVKSDRIGGDVSQKERKKKGERKNPHDTAPAIEDCKPLEVNNDTRWKPKVMDKDGGAEEEETEVQSKEEVLRQAMLILNKLSLTKFDKLSDAFIDCGIGRDVETLTGAVGLIVTYAQEQQHFSSMYAGLCLKLANTPMEGVDGTSKKGKKFKKILLERCQTEFETDTATKIKEATKGSDDKDVIAYHSTLCKKHYLGHMRFIGELYKGDLISIKIMLFCLPALLKGEDEDSSSEEVDEEKIECFSKLMTVIGSSLEQQSQAMRSVGKSDAAENLAGCWRLVEIMAGKRKEKGPDVSNRIKFMLQDLLEMKSKGWVTRRVEETAKTIAQIHKEVEREERAAKSKRSSSSASLRGMNKGSVRRGASSGDVRQLDKTQSKPQVDKDGFVSVNTSSQKGFNRSASMGVMHRSQSKEGFQKYSTRGSTSGDSSQGGGRRPSQGKFAVLNERSSKKGSSAKLDKMDEKKAVTEENKPEKPKVNYLSADECGEKAKRILKEFFVGGDADDAVLSIHELVGAGDEGSTDRGAKMVEGALLLVMEMKDGDVDKFLKVFLRCAEEKKIEGSSFVTGLNDPLEFLNDVAIDAPLAIPHMVNIVAELVKASVIPFDFLLNAPEYFRTDQNSAGFGAKVTKKIGGDASTKEEYIEVIEKLMTDEDKAKHSSAADLIAEA